MIARVTLDVTHDAAKIVGLLEPLLAADPVRNTVFSGVVAGLQAPDADGWCVRPAGRADVLAVRSQLHTPVVVTAGWGDLASLADVIGALPSLASIGGPVRTIEALVAALGDRGIAMISRMTERLFRLDELTETDPVPGRPRLASSADLELLAVWYEAFLVDAFGRPPPGFDHRAAAERGLARSRIWLWTDEAGDPTSMAVRQPTTFGVSRIGPVYTPAEARGHGYGSAATAVATRDTLADGAVPVLFTDLGNPTSNRIYQRLGYYPVEDRAHVAFV